MMHLFVDALLTGLLGSTAFLIAMRRLRTVAAHRSRNLRPGPEPRCLQPLPRNGRASDR